MKVKDLQAVEGDNKTTMYYIYSLSDPRDKTTHYVGMTSQVKRRFSEHLRCDDTNVEKATWIKNLQRSGFQPLLTIIDQSEKLELAKQYEEYWIGFFKRANEPICNMLTLDLYRRAERRLSRGED